MLTSAACWYFGHSRLCAPNLTTKLNFQHPVSRFRRRSLGDLSTLPCLLSFSPSPSSSSFPQTLIPMAAAKGTILVTGANGGLGSAIAAQIASSPELSAYHGIYTVRDATSSPALTSALEHGVSPHPHDVVSLDLTKLNNVRQVAEDIDVSLAVLDSLHPVSLTNIFRLASPRGLSPRSER